jgi:hypothetical protein
MEVHGGVAAGKLVVTLETATEGETVERLNAVQLLDGVLAAAKPSASSPSAVMIASSAASRSSICVTDCGWITTGSGFRPDFA